MLNKTVPMLNLIHGHSRHAARLDSHDVLLDGQPSSAVETIEDRIKRLLIEVDGFGTSVLAAPGGQNRFFRPF